MGVAMTNVAHGTRDEPLATPRHPFSPARSRREHAGYRPRLNGRNETSVAQFTTAYCLLPTAYCLLPTAYCRTCRLHATCRPDQINVTIINKEL